MNRAARHDLAHALAWALLAGPWEQEALVRRARSVAPLEPFAIAGLPWSLRDLVRDVLAAYAHPPADRPRELVAFVALALPVPPSDVPWPRARRWHLTPPRTVRRPWPVPALDTVADLGAFLGLDDGALAWLADVRGLERRAGDGRLRHYRYAWIARPDAPVRLLEQPKPRLKALQRRILHEVLAPIPVHPAAHGFVPGRSVRTHAAAHAGAPVVLRFDVQDFFVSLSAARVYGVLRSAGYPEAVAHALTGLATNSTNIAAWRQIPVPRDPALAQAHGRLGRRLAAPHLPQGAPTSPLLANLCAFSLDRRLTGLAAALDATYTRYADDLVLSGGTHLGRRAAPIGAQVRAIVADEGLRLNAAKTTVMPRARRQLVAGIVVNAHANVPREEFDRLKATLHNCVRDGPAPHNRDGVADFRAHLLGRIAWVASLNPARGARLRRDYDAIDWRPRV